MLEFLCGLDEGLFHAINGAWPAGDTLIWWTSKPLAWTPLYLVLAYAVCKKYSQTSSRLFVLLGLVICIGVNDVLSSRILKPTSERLRPSHREEFVDTIHLYERSDGTYYKGGKWSFVSGHAANHMGAAIFMGAVLCGGFVLGGWMWGLIAWALLIGYSRVHLGVHFPGDVLCGWLVGGAVGACVFKTISRRI